MGKIQLIRKHWMVRYRRDETVESLKDLTEHLDQYGYESLLFLINSALGDMWTKLVTSINDRHSFKYMIAFRPYLLSPQYLSMLSSSFNEISKDRLMLNLVHGIVGMEETMSGIINGELFKDPKFRREYAEEFMEKFLHHSKLYKPFQIPETLVSGSSNESIRLAKKSSNIVATFAESFLEDPKRFTDHGFAKIFVPLSILVRDTDEEAEEEVSLIPKEKRVINGDSLYGSRETVKKKILELESFGVTDILFSHFDPQHDPQPVHEFLNQLTKDGILS